MPSTAYYTSCARCVRRDRTGVQLKDKWRNLVKFKHVSRVEADVAAAKSASLHARCCGLGHPMLHAVSERAQHADCAAVWLSRKANASGSGR